MAFQRNQFKAYSTPLWALIADVWLCNIWAKLLALSETLCYPTYIT